MIDDNITKFHIHVNQQVTALAARGEITTDLITYLFKAYKVVKHPEFAQYIKMQQDLHNDSIKVYTPNTLMECADNKYRSLVESGDWAFSAKREKDIIALSAAMATLTKKVAASSSKQTKSNGKKRLEKGSKKGQFKTPAWKFEPPKDGAKTRVQGGRTYHWCTKHERPMWTVHTPQDCKSQPPSGSKFNHHKESSKKALQLSNALISIMENEDENSYEE